jgi:hypothetical protein
VSVSAVLGLLDKPVAYRQEWGVCPGVRRIAIEREVRKVVAELGREFAGNVVFCGRALYSSVM